MGRKIKVLAQVMMWIGVVMCGISGLIVLAQGFELMQYSEEGILMVLMGLLIAGLGFLMSWVSSFMLYGFGQIVENSDKIVNILEQHTGISGESYPQYGQYSQYGQYGQYDQYGQYGQPQQSQSEYNPYANSNQNNQ